MSVYVTVLNCVNFATRILLSAFYMNKNPKDQDSDSSFHCITVCVDCALALAHYWLSGRFEFDNHFATFRCPIKLFWSASFFCFMC